MGDLSQGIHSYRSISSWNVLMKEVFGDARVVYREILYSYRSAKEIIDVFNRVMPANIYKSNTCIRNRAKADKRTDQFY